VLSFSGSPKKVYELFYKSTLFDFVSFCINYFLDEYHLLEGNE